MSTESDFALVVRRLARFRGAKLVIERVKRRVQTQHSHLLLRDRTWSLPRQLGGLPPGGRPLAGLVQYVRANLANLTLGCAGPGSVDALTISPCGCTRVGHDAAAVWNLGRASGLAIERSQGARSSDLPPKCPYCTFHQVLP